MQAWIDRTSVGAFIGVQVIAIALRKVQILSKCTNTVLMRVTLTINSQNLVARLKFQSASVSNSVPLTQTHILYINMKKEIQKSQITNNKKKKRQALMPWKLFTFRLISISGFIGVHLKSYLFA